MKRPTNPELVAAFRDLLTKQFYAINDDGEVLEGEERERALRATKPWRNEVWKAFAEIEARLCPLEALAKQKERNNARNV